MARPYRFVGMVFHINSENDDRDLLTFLTTTNLCNYSDEMNKSFPIFPLDY